MLNKSLAVFALGTLSVFSAPAMAAGCLDGNTMTCVTEKNVNFLGSLGVEYGITNNSGQQLFGFGVSNTPANPGIESQIYSFTTGWQGAFIAADSWDDGIAFNFYDAATHSEEGEMTKQWISGAQPLQYQSEAETAPVFLGTFAERFGTDETHVAFFWNTFEASNELADGVSLDNFFLSESPNSNFSTFGALGNVVSTSVAAVPEPETYAMFLAGLGLLGFARRNKQA